MSRFAKLGLIADHRMAQLEVLVEKILSSYRKRRARFLDASFFHDTLILKAWENRTLFATAYDHFIKLCTNQQKRAKPTSFVDIHGRKKFAASSSNSLQKYFKFAACVKGLDFLWVNSIIIPDFSPRLFYKYFPYNISDPKWTALRIARNAPTPRRQERNEPLLQTTVIISNFTQRDTSDNCQKSLIAVTSSAPVRLLKNATTRKWHHWKGERFLEYLRAFPTQSNHPECHN